MIDTVPARPEAKANPNLAKRKKKKGKKKEEKVSENINTKKHK